MIDNAVNAFLALNLPNYDNTFNNNYYNCPLGSIAGENTVADNVQVKGEWPAQAQAIMDNAGLSADAGSVSS